MNKKQYLRRLRSCLRVLPRKEIKASLKFYDEAISDRMERGMDERSAVADMEYPEIVAIRIIKEMPEVASAKLRANNRLRTILFWCALPLSLPVALSLGAAAVSVAVSLAAVMFSVIVSLYAAALSLALCVPAGIVLAIMSFADLPVSAIWTGAALIAAGLAFIISWLAGQMARLCMRLFRYIFRRRKGR